MNERHDEDVWRDERDRIRFEADQLAEENEKRAAERRKRLRAFTGIGRDYQHHEDEHPIESRFVEERAEREYRRA